MGMLKQFGKTKIYVVISSLCCIVIVLSDSENEFNEGDLEEAESDDDMTVGMDNLVPWNT